MTVFIYTTQTAHGIVVIVNNLVAAFQREGVNSIHITNLDNRIKDDIIIPYGVKEAHEVLRKGFKPFAVFLADAITLGYVNKVKFYLRHLHFFHYDFLYCLYGYLKYTGQEKTVVSNYENVILVSDIDIKYLKEKYPMSTCSYMCVANGAPVIRNIKDHIHAKYFRVGLLSSWVTRQTFEESNWFVQGYWRKYHKTHPNVSLCVAGRGALSEKFAKVPGVNVIGEVADLGDFFANCDISLLLCPKGCGVLNRVLDSFVYKVPVVGYEASFSGVPHSDGICYKFTSYLSFEQTMNHVMNNKEEVLAIADKALEYTKEYHNWERNYNLLVKRLICELNHNA